MYFHKHVKITERKHLCSNFYTLCHNLSFLFFVVKIRHFSLGTICEKLSKLFKKIKKFSD